MTSKNDLDAALRVIGQSSTKLLQEASTDLLLGANINIMKAWLASAEQENKALDEVASLDEECNKWLEKARRYSRPLTSRRELMYGSAVKKLEALQKILKGNEVLEDYLKWAQKHPGKNVMAYNRTKHNFDRTKLRQSIYVHNIANSSYRHSLYVVAFAFDEAVKRNFGSEVLQHPKCRAMSKKIIESIEPGLERLKFDRGDSVEATDSSTGGSGVNQACAKKGIKRKRSTDSVVEATDHSLEQLSVEGKNSIIEGYSIGNSYIDPYEPEPEFFGFEPFPYVGGLTGPSPYMMDEFISQNQTQPPPDDL